MTGEATNITPDLGQNNRKKKSLANAWKQKQQVSGSLPLVSHQLSSSNDNTEIPSMAPGSEPITTKGGSTKTVSKFPEMACESAVVALCRVVDVFWTAGR
jgi:hypothetical protein